MKGRDKRLLVAIAGFLSSIALFYFDISKSVDYLVAWTTGEWKYFGETYSVDVSRVLSGRCFDCEPAMPNQWTMLWMPLFIGSLSLTIFAWWKPKQ